MYHTTKLPNKKFQKSDKNLQTFKNEKWVEKLQESSKSKQSLSSFYKETLEII
jgi:hypothetical protein